MGAMSLPGDRLRGRIRDSGPIPFGEFMQEALYGPGGYYARAELPIGVEGDYGAGAGASRGAVPPDAGLGPDPAPAPRCRRRRAEPRGTGCQGDRGADLLLRAFR